MKRPTDRGADASLTRKRALIRSLIEQSRQAHDTDESTSAPVALFRVVGDEADEPAPETEQPMAEIIPFPFHERP